MIHIPSAITCSRNPLSMSTHLQEPGRSLNCTAAATSHQVMFRTQEGAPTVCCRLWCCSNMGYPQVCDAPARQSAAVGAEQVQRWVVGAERVPHPAGSKDTTAVTGVQHLSTTLHPHTHCSVPLVPGAAHTLLLLHTRMCPRTGTAHHLLPRCTRIVVLSCHSSGGCQSSGQ